jgi:ATP-dependent DNA helicase RecQ
LNEFDRLHQALSCLPDVTHLSEPFSDRSCEQLRRAVLSACTDPASVGPGDLAGLVRHVLRRGYLETRAPYWLLVPIAEPWPSQSLWLASFVKVMAKDQSTFRVTAAKAWSASWLEHSQSTPPLTASFQEVFRRQGWPASPNLPLDTALEFGLQLPFKGYQGPGQRLAIRSAFFLRPGGTLVVNLPTGTGKSLVAWGPALLAAGNELTVMITPTIALAIDQERQLREQYSAVSQELPREMAWHSGLSEVGRKAILQRLRTGSQRILITSPESFVGSLSRSLYQTTAEGRLKYFVVDEAHLVAQWGNDFRPQFQAMSGMRRDLLNQCPPQSRFRTLLLSATLTQESFDVLETLFSEGDFDSVNAVALRPEPEYWLSHSQTKSEREEKVIELARVVPRPFLLYVTTQRDAEDWIRKLRELGVKRLGCVHGGTSNDVRERIIDLWRQREIDCVVATSAFGLGMDKSDVRTVIHACIPESIDRFYQEVGRAGRDGCASVSFLLPCEEADKSIAKSISQDRIISLEKGADRWKSLIQSAKARQDRWCVDLNTRLPHIEQDSEANAAWNLRTLVLLNRAGVIRLESSEPPTIEREEHESDLVFAERRQAALDRYFSTAFLRILRDDHLSNSLWESLVKAERDRMYAASEQAFARMEKLLAGNTDIGELLQETYTIQTANGGASPDRTCSGCPHCRRIDAEKSSRFTQPEPDLVSCIEHGDFRRLKELFHSSLVFVRCSKSRSHREAVKLYLRFVQRLVDLGVDEFALPDTWKAKRDWKRIHERSTHRFVVCNPIDKFDIHKNDLRLPRATFLLEESAPIISPALITMDRPYHIIFAPEEAREYGTLRNFFDVHPHVRDHEFARRIGQS